MERDEEVEERAPLTSCRKLSVHSCDHYERRKRRRIGRFAVQPLTVAPMTKRQKSILISQYCI